MILAECLWPGMTRQGYGNKGVLTVRSEDLEKLPRSHEGRLLPLASIALRDYTAALERLKNDSVILDEIRRGEMGMTALKAISVDDETGCWHHAQTLDDENHTKLLWTIAAHDFGGEPLDPKDSKRELRVCDEGNCLNARHYDITHRKSYRDEIIKPDYHLFETLESGDIMPHWQVGVSGVLLPPVSRSAQDFLEFRARCAPFTEAPDKAPLTVNGISKITIDPVTGCWLARSYYTRPKHGSENFQYDGYGRLGPGPGLRAAGVPPMQIVAHRMVWRGTRGPITPGKELNHECGVRSCCYPEHLTQVDRGANIQHSFQMRRARAAHLSGQTLMSFS